MGDNLPLSAEIPLILQALDFFRELKNELLTERHKQFVYGDRVIIGCFILHVLEANNIMTMPLPLAGYIRPSYGTSNCICTCSN